MKAKTADPILPYVRFLAENIGTRGTGTGGEKKAAEYVFACLKKWAIPSEMLTCESIISMNHYPLSINALGILAILLYPIPGVWARWLAAVLALLVAPFMTLTIRTSTNPLRRFLRKVKSPSVLGSIEPAADMQQQVVLISHLDTNKCRLTWRPEGLKNLEPLTYVTLVVQALLGILYLYGAIAGERWSVWLVSLLPGAYLLAMIITLFLDDRTPYSPGANDNASSVGVVLHIAEALSIKPLAHTRVWFAFSGAEETDHFGLRSILNAHTRDMRQALFIDLEGVGAGELVMVTRHGIGLHYAPDPGLLASAKKVAEEHPEWCIEGKKMVMSEEVSTLTHLGYRAICISGYDPSTGGLPQWHQREDTVENLDPDCLIKARDFTFALLKKIDSA
jgi:hypothetical protein